MKMIVAIMSDQDSQPVTQALIQAGYRATRIGSTGAFLRRGSSTMLIGVDNEKVDDAFQVIRTAISLLEPDQKHITLFVVDVEQFTQV
jgi:uncharacterized protein YaaQ